MNSPTGIRTRTVEISTLAPEKVESDALLLPWRQNVPGDEDASAVVQRAGAAVLEEIADYRGEREVMLTSAGSLPMRFLFHLSMPAEGKIPIEMLEERFRDCLFQAGILRMNEIAIPLLEFSSYVENFSDLVATVWRACREFVARERGPKRVLFLIEDRDLRGQYLRHFFNRKIAESEGWGVLDSSKRPASVLRRAGGSGSPRPSYSQFEMERVLSLEVADPETAEGRLQDLLTEYSEGRGFDIALEALLPPMRGALRHCFSQNGAGQDLPKRLRILGSDTVLRLPWELVHESGTFMGEQHLLTRGTNFLHFNRDCRAHPGIGPRVSFRVAGGTEAARSVVDEIGELAERLQPDLRWCEESEADVRLLHCLEEEMARQLVERESPSYEVVLLDLESGDSRAGPPTQGMEELARDMLAAGCRRVLVPLARFRNRQERQVYRRAFYDRLLAGMKVGDAHQFAQRAMMEAFGAYSGWWLTRIFGQTDEAILPAGVQTGGQGRLRGGV